MNIETGNFDDGGYLTWGYLRYANNIAKKEEERGTIEKDENGFWIHRYGDMVSVINYEGTEKNVTIPNGVKSISEWAFWKCDFATIIIPETVTEILYGAFRYCNNLKSIIIPKTVEKIDRIAFSGCESLASVIFDDPDGWIVSSKEDFSEATTLNVEDLSNVTTALRYITDTYQDYYWKRN